MSLFREKRYADAYADFRRLLQSEPDDARLWYFAALSYGLSTGNWDRMTLTMVEEGIAREKAAKPPKPEIDAALAGLTTQTGKDWLDFYRSTRAGDRPIDTRRSSAERDLRGPTPRPTPRERRDSGRAGAGGPSSPT